MLNFLFPKACIGCSKIGHDICADCATSLSRANTNCIICKSLSLSGVCQNCLKKNSPDAVLAAFRFEGLVREIIHELKFSDISDYADFCACSIVEVLEKSKIPYKKCVLTEIPLHPKRKRSRGYNQSGLIAAKVGKMMGLKHCRLLKRAIDTEPQSSMINHEEKSTNVKGCFKADKIEMPKHILLIDDVTTTGSTFREAVKVLKKYGAEKVYCVSVCKGK